MPFSQTGFSPAAYLLLLFLILSGAGGLCAQTAGTLSTPGENSAAFFPAAFFTGFLETWKTQEADRPYWVFTESESEAYYRRYLEEPLLLNSDILAFYGHPRSKNMGILGRHTKEELNEKLDTLAAEYQAQNNGRRIRKAFYLIYGTVWPAGEIGILSESILTEYIDFALKNDILIFIDHQIGRYDPVDSLRRMLPWLRYPNVHLALDPEWRTAKPMEEIGTMTANEINRAQRIMEEYIIENKIPGERLLVIHQFNHRMISSRDQVETTFRRVRLVHCADGFGSPAVKRQSYAYNARALNMPVKGFKLFYDSGISGAGYDIPLLQPEEVFALNPRPYVIMYQ